MRYVLVGTGLLVVAAACVREPDPLVDAGIDPAALSVFAQLPPIMSSDANPVTPAKVTLGRMLYYDSRLSRDGDVSCNSCHALDAYGVDHRPTSEGLRHQLGGRNAPTVYHAAGQVAQFWDGRAPSVEEQAKGPILNPIEMGMPDSGLVVERLRAQPEYVRAFRAAFPGEDQPVTYDHVGQAIGAFERGLVTPARWDALLGGNHRALTATELDGLRIFLDTGCQACHHGAYVGGTMFQRVGLVQPWPRQDDLGRFAITGREADRLVFKVPSLRNVDRTGPYFHDGRVATLDEAVRLMARHQLGRELTDGQIVAVVAWLESLTGPVPADYIAVPLLPASGTSPSAGP